MVATLKQTYPSLQSDRENTVLGFIGQWNLKASHSSKGSLGAEGWLPSASGFFSELISAPLPLHIFACTGPWSAVQPDLLAFPVYFSLWYHIGGYISAWKYIK